MRSASSRSRKHHAAMVVIATQTAAVKMRLRSSSKRSQMVIALLVATKPGKDAGRSPPKIDMGRDDFWGPRGEFQIGVRQYL